MKILKFLMIIAIIMVTSLLTMVIADLIPDKAPEPPEPSFIITPKY